jgi:hypothetical protein
MILLAGWLTGDKMAAPRRPSNPRYGELALVVACALGWYGLHGPRVEKLIIEAAPVMSETERAVYLIPGLQKQRAIYRTSELKERQARSLARLEQVGRLAGRLGVSRSTLRKQFGRFEPPGWPHNVTQLDGFDLIGLPDVGGPRVSASATIEIARGLANETLPDFDAIARQYLQPGVGH